MINCSWQDMSEFPPRYGWVPSLDPVGCAEIDPALRVTMNDLHSYWKWPFIVSFPIRNDVLTSPMEQLYINPLSKPSFFKESWSNHGVSARVSVHVRNSVHVGAFHGISGVRWASICFLLAWWGEIGIQWVCRQLGWFLCAIIFNLYPKDRKW